MARYCRDESKNLDKKSCRYFSERQLCAFEDLLPNEILKDILHLAKTLFDLVAVDA